MPRILVVDSSIYVGPILLWSIRIVIPLLYACNSELDRIELTLVRCVSLIKSSLKVVAHTACEVYSNLCRTVVSIEVYTCLIKINIESNVVLSVRWDNVEVCC